MRRRIQRIERTGDVSSDEVQKPAPAVAVKAASHDVRERREVTDANVLEHPDRDERVEPAAHVPVVVVDELDPAAEPFAFGPVPCEGELFT